MSSQILDYLLSRDALIALAIAIILLLIALLQWLRSRKNEEIVEKSIAAFKEIFGKK